MKELNANLLSINSNDTSNFDDQDDELVSSHKQNFINNKKFFIEFKIIPYLYYQSI
jgi:hypothetical protein